MANKFSIKYIISSNSKNDVPFIELLENECESVSEESY